MKLLAAVQAETSTGVLQPLCDLRTPTHDHDVRFLINSVTSLDGSGVDLGDMDIDFAYSATQKRLGAPHGMPPLAVPARGGSTPSATARKRPVADTPTSPC